MPDGADGTLREALLRLLAIDFYPRTGAVLAGDPRLLSGAARGTLDDLVAEAGRGELPFTVELVVQHRSFLLRCSPRTLPAVFPMGDETVDPQVVAAVRVELERAWAAGAAYTERGAAEDLGAADRAWQQVVAAPALSSAYPDLRAALLNDAAGTALRWFWHAGTPADLDRAGGLYQGALDLTPPNSARRVDRLGNLAMVRREVHLRSGDEDALTDAELLLREASALVERSRGQLPGTEVLTNLALVLRDRYLLSRDQDVLEAAIDAALRASKATGATGPQIMLGDLLTLRHQVTGQLDELDQAVTLLARALDRVPGGAPERPRAVVDLAVALSERHEVLGAPADLDAAVQLIEDARALLPSTAPDLLSADAQLAVMRYRRFESSGRLDDLDQAADLLSAVLAAPGAEVAVPTWQANLAAVLIQRSRRTGNPTDLDRAVEIFVGLAAGGSTSTDRYAVLNNLGNALRDRSRREPDGTDLDRSVTFLREAIELCADGSTRLAATLANLGVALHDRAMFTREPADLREALEVTERALRIDADDADLARRWFARALVAQTATNNGWTAGHEATIDAYREGCRIGMIADPESTLIAAQDWGGWATARRDWALASEAYPIALDAIDALVARQVVRDHQEAWLRATPGLAERAAWAAEAAGRPGDAVLALERTRARLLSEAMQRDRADLARLGRLRPDLEQRYRLAVAALRDRGGRGVSHGG